MRRAADEFDKHINIVAPGQCDRVIFPAVARQAQATVFVA